MGRNASIAKFSYFHSMTRVSLGGCTVFELCFATSRTSKWVGRQVWFGATSLAPASRGFPPFPTLSVTPVARAFNLLASFEIENGQKDFLGFNLYAQYALG